MSDVKVPKWLQKLVKQVTEADGWPNGKFPEVGKEVWNVVMEYGDDGQLSLLQLVIDEVERLRTFIHERVRCVKLKRTGGYHGRRIYLEAIKILTAEEKGEQK